MKDCYLRKCILVDLENLIGGSTGNLFMLMSVFVINTTTLSSNSNVNRVENFLDFEYRFFFLNEMLLIKAVNNQCIIRAKHKYFFAFFVKCRYFRTEYNSNVIKFF